MQLAIVSGVLGHEGVDFTFNFLLQPVKVGDVVLLLLPEHIQLPLPEVGLSKCLFSLLILMLFPLLDFISHQLDHCHFCAIRVAASKVLDPSETSGLALFLETRSDRAHKSLHGGRSKKRAPYVPVGLPFVVHLCLAHQLLNPRSHFLGLGKSGDDSFVLEQLV